MKTKLRLREQRNKETRKGRFQKKALVRLGSIAMACAIATTSLVSPVNLTSVITANAEITPTANPGEPYQYPTGILRSGSRGSSVSWLQAGLNICTGTGLSVDGIYGNNTVQAVKNFQASQGLTVDGIAGSQTVGRLADIWRVRLDKTAPNITNVTVTNITTTGYTVSCNVSDNMGVTRVEFPTWTNEGGQDDLIWHKASVSNGRASFTVKASEHKNGMGTYFTHIYAWDANGNQKCVAAPTQLLSGLKTLANAGDDFYARIRNTSTNNCLTEKNNNVASYKPTEEENQIWHFTRNADGTYDIKALATDNYLYFGGKDACYANVTTLAIANKWKLYSAGNGKYFLQGVGCTETALDLADGASAEGTNIRLHSVNRTVAQTFELDMIDLDDYYAEEDEENKDIVADEDNEIEDDFDEEEDFEEEDDDFDENADVIADSDNDEEDLSEDEQFVEEEEDISDQDNEFIIEKDDEQFAEEDKEENEEENTNDISVKEEEKISVDENECIIADPDNEDTDDTQDQNQPADNKDEPEQNVPSKEDNKVTPNPSTKADNEIDENEDFDEEEDEEDFDEEEDEFYIDQAEIISAKRVKGKKIKLRFEALDGATKYEVYYGCFGAKGYKKLVKLRKNQGKLKVGGIHKITTKKTKLTLKNIKKKKTYYLIVRGYAKVNGKKVYGNYSKIYKVRS